MRGKEKDKSHKTGFLLSQLFLIGKIILIAKLLADFKRGEKSLQNDPCLLLTLVNGSGELRLAWFFWSSLVLWFDGERVG